MKKRYEIGFVFFISIEEEDAIERKDTLLDALDENGIFYDVYNDGEDWNIDCIAKIKATSGKKAEMQLEKMIGTTIPYEAWDYHYVRGLDDNYRWQP